MGILAMLFSIGLVANFDDYRRQPSRSERDAIVLDLEEARSESMNNIDGMAHSAHGVTFAQLSGDVASATVIRVGSGMQTYEISINTEGGIDY